MYDSNLKPGLQHVLFLAHCTTVEPLFTCILPGIAQNPKDREIYQFELQVRFVS